jgi:hypothetical protein
MLADPHHELFNLLVRVKRAKPSAARKIAAAKGYRSASAALKDLDKRFAELEAGEPLTPRHKAWLKSLRKLRLVPDAEMTANLQRAAQTNPLLPRRKAEADRLRAEKLRSEPPFKALKSLCDMAELKITAIRKMGFAPMRSAWPDGPDVRAYVLRAETDKGPRSALFYCEGRLLKRHLAVLVEQGAALPAGSLSLSKQDYLAIVPKEA